MNIIQNFSLTRRSIGLGILAIFIGVYAASTSSAWYKKISQSQKKIEQFKSIHPEPVELQEIRSKNKPLVLSKVFKGEDDWLNGMEFKLKNVSTKDIIYFELYLNFPETTSSGNEMAFPLRFGKTPETSELKEVPVFKPSEEITLKIDENNYKWLTLFLEKRHSISSLSLMRVDFGFVVFRDHTAWKAGDYLVQDPANPRHYINVGETPPKN